MGVEDWENKYKGQGKPQLSDFLDDEEDNIILRMGRPHPEPSHISGRQNTQRSGFLPATYPEGYDTIDRRRKRTLRNPGGMLSSEADKIREEGSPSDFALLREKRGELFLRQVAEMQEEEERMSSCLKPYKNGLLYKTRMWAKTELDHTLENYVAYKKEQDARMRAQLDFDLESSEDVPYRGVDEDIDDLTFTSEDFHRENTRHYKEKYSFPCDGHIENTQGFREKKNGKAKLGGWGSEVMLSPVEEPSDEYVDPMDELQCLVETVSEYLAEKEEEISKYGSLPKSSKSRLSSLGSNRTDSFGEDHASSSKDPRGENQSHAPSDQSVSGVKNAMSSIFSSLTDRVGGGSKQPNPPSQAPSAPPSQSGLTKLFSFLPKSNATPPVAVVSPVENSPEKSFSSLPSQSLHNAKTQIICQDTRVETQPSTKEADLVNKPQCPQGNSVLGKFYPLKLFAAGDNGNTTECKQASDATYPHGHGQWNEKHVHEGKQQITVGARIPEKLSSLPEKHLRPKEDENIHARQNSVIYKPENVPTPGPAQSNCQTQSTNNGFFSPFKKSLSSLITLAPVPPQGPPPVTVYPVFRNTEDPRLEKPVENPSLGSKLPFLSSENVSTQHHPKAEGGMLSGFLKFASSDDVSASMNTQNPVQSRQDSKSTATTTVTQHPPVANENTGKGWFSSIFNPTPAPSAPNQNFPNNQQSQTSNVSSGHQVQPTLNKEPTAAHRGMQHQGPSQPVSQGFLSGLFKGNATEDTSHMSSDQPKQGGLLSGLFGSLNDLSGNVSQQPSHNNQPPKTSNPTNVHPHPAPQQRPAAPQKGGFVSGLLRFSSTENIPQNTQPPEAKNQTDIPSNYSPPLQTLEETQTQPQQKGLLSGLLKFGSSEKVSSSQTVPHHQQSSAQHHQGFNPNSAHSPHQAPHTGNRVLSHQVVQQEMSKPGFTRQQTVPLQQKPSQGGLLSGLFKFASADNVNTQQHPPDQQHIISSSKSSYEQQRMNNPIPNNNQTQSSSTQKAPQSSSLLSGLFKSSSEQTQQPQPRISQETQQIKVPNSQTTEIHPETASQSGVISGLFNKLTKSSENIGTASQTSTGQLLHQKASNISTMKTPQQTQLHTNVTLPSSQEQDKKMTRSAQQGFLSGLFSKNVTEEPSTPKQVETSEHNIEQLRASPFGVLKSGPVDITRDPCQRVLQDYFNPGQSRHALIRPPASIDTESLDLRTSATFARSLQNQATYSSFSTGNLSQLYYSGSIQSVHPMAYSTGNIHTHLQSNTSPLMSTQSGIGRSSSSLYEAATQLSPYGMSPSYDENQWIRQSALWQQFQNESLNYQHQGESQMYRPSCEGTPLQAPHIQSNSSNIYQQFNPSTPWHNQQEQIGPYLTEVHGNNDPRKKLWNSYDDLGNIEYPSNEEGVLNLTTKPVNPRFGKWNSFNDGSTYSLNGVSYHEGYYEETAPSLSYSANWQHGMDNAAMQNFHNESMMHQNQFNLNRPVDSNYPPNAKADVEDSVYLEDTEWYQQWLTLLEQGMWWPAEDGDCGYFVYTDHEYIYALLTDAAGEYVYACGPDGESFGNTPKLDGFPSAWLHNEMVYVCGFKIPLYNEDELLWLPGQDQCDPQLLNAPLDLSDAYRKGNQIMNLNLEQFSQMFENSFMSQGQQEPDFTSYRLNKIRMDPRQSSYVYEDQCKDIIDLSCHNRNNNGPNWNNRDIRTFLSQKVSVSLNSSPAANLNQQLLFNCYQPSERRSSTGITIKHVDDVLEEEWRRRVAPGQAIPNRQVKKISSLISTFAGKQPQDEINKSSTASGDQAPDKTSKNIISSGFQSLKSKIIKEEPSVVVTQSESVKQIQRPSTSQGRILPTIPTAAEVTQPSQKPRLSRQTTMAQQPMPPSQPNVRVPSGSKELQITPKLPEQLRADKADVPVEKPPEQPQGGLMNFFKSAVGIEEPKPDSQKCSQTNQQSKSGSTSSLSGSAPPNAETSGVSNLFGSISSLFSAEPTPPQKQQMKPSATEGSLTSAPRPKGLQRQQTVDKSGASRPVQSQHPNKSVSQVLPPNSSGPATARSQTMPLTEQTKQNTETKPSGGLFGFSIGEMLTGSTTPAQSGNTTQVPSPASAPQEESLGKSILSMFSGPASQASPNTGPSTQTSSAAPPPPQQESLGKSLFSMFGGSGPPQPPTENKPASEGPQQGAIPPKDPPNTGFLSIFGGPSPQQSQAQTGSILGGILPGSSSSTESPMKGLLSMFSEPSPPQPQPPASSTQRAPQSQTRPQGEPQTQSRSQPQSQGQGPSGASVLGGLFGGLSTSSEGPRKSLFSVFSGPSGLQTPGTGGSSNLSTSPQAAAPKESAKSIFSVINDAVSPPQQAPDLSSATGTAAKESQDTSLQQSSAQLSCGSSSQEPVVASTIDATSERHDRLSTDTTIDTEKSATIKSTEITAMETSTEHGAVQKEISIEGGHPECAPPKEPPASGLLSMITGSGPQTPSSQAGFMSDSPGKGLLSLFSGPNTGGPSATGSVPASTGPKDAPGKGLFSVLGGAAPQPSSQPGSSLLGAMFGGPSPQTSNQSGGSLLGGLFGGPTTQSAPPPGPAKTSGSAPQTAGPQAGTSLLGGLFGGSAPQAAGPQTAGSILGGIFGGSAASTSAPQPSSPFGGLFGGAGNQTSASSNNSSILGGILGGSSQTASAQSGGSILGGILSGVSAPNEKPDKSTVPVSGESVPAAIPTALKSNDDKTTLDTTSDLTALPKSSADSKVIGPEISVNTDAGRNQEETLQQTDSTIHGLEANLPKTDTGVTEHDGQNTDKATTLSNDAQPKESEVCVQTQQPTESEMGAQPSRPDLIDQSSQGAIPPKAEEQTSATRSGVTTVEGQQKPPEEARKSVGDPAIDAVTGFMSSLFKPTTTPTEGTTSSQSAAGQGGASLLGGIFGGSTTEPSAPQAGVSLLGGLFKGSAPQSGSQATNTTTGGSLLGGMFGGSTAKPAGPQTGGSVLGGMFGGAASTAQPGGSLLGGMFGGATAQTAGPTTGASVLGSIGGSLFGGIGQPKPSGPVSAQPKPTPDTKPQQQIKNESLTVSASTTETSTNKPVDSVLPNSNQEQSGIPTNSSVIASEAVCPEASDVKSAPVGTSDLTPQADNTENEKSALDEDVIHEKPIVIKEEPQNKESDKSAPPDTQEAHTNVAPTANQLPDNTEPPQAKSLFGFISTPNDAGKSLGSLFSPTIPSGAMSAPQTEGGNGLFSGLKSLSGGLFQEDKPVSGKQEPSTTSLFGAKISFPWQAEPPKPEPAPAVTSQPKTDNKITSDQTVTVSVAASAPQKLVGDKDDTSNPQIFISTPEVDPSASLTPKENEGLVETHPSAGPTSGVQLDNQSKMDELNAKRLVKA